MGNGRDGVAGRYSPPMWAVSADAVWYAMRKAGVDTVAELERMTGVPYTTLNNAICGQTPRPSADVMCRVADALGCDVMDLMEAR